MAEHIPANLLDFPCINGIVFALQNDQLHDKKITALLRQNDPQSALKIALSTSSRRHRFIAISLFFLKEKLNWIPPLNLTLKFCELLGPSSAWFSYLQKSTTRPSLLTATRLIQDLNGTQTILDVGCGVGHLAFQFPSLPNRKWICVDKNFFSLFLAQLYHSRDDIIYICADVEVQDLLQASSCSVAICIDSFDFIFNKERFIFTLGNILKKSGKFIMVNLHEESAETTTWGYGMNHRELTKVLKKIFSKVVWHDMNDPLHSRRNSFSELDPLRYSFVAQK